MLSQTTCPPPKRFVAAVEVRSAKLLAEQPPFIRRKRSTGRFAVGVRYERRVLEHLSLLVLGDPRLQLKPGPWIEFQDRQGKRWCQPDAVLLNLEQRLAFVYEVKYQHTADAWWQLRWLYSPVLEKIYPGWTLGLMEICHWHDPAIRFPEEYDLSHDFFHIPRRNRVAVHIWSGKRHQLGLPIS